LKKRENAVAVLFFCDDHSNFLLYIARFPVWYRNYQK